MRKILILIMLAFLAPILYSMEYSPTDQYEIIGVAHGDFVPVNATVSKNGEFLLLTVENVKINGQAKLTIPCGEEPDKYYLTDFYPYNTSLEGTEKVVFKVPDDGNAYVAGFRPSYFVIKMKADDSISVVFYGTGWSVEKLPLKANN